MDTSDKPAPSRSPSPYQGRRRNRSSSPYSKQKAPRQRHSPPPAARNRFDKRPAAGGNGAPHRPPPAQPVQRERSLSPYSKRMALTRQMQMG